VAARYAKAPSYSELLAGEARAVVRAAGEAAEAARNAQAAAQAVLAGLESGPIASGMWEPTARNSGSALDERAFAQPEAQPSEMHAAPARWQDEPPSAAVAPVGHESPRAGAQPRWDVALPVTAPAPTQAMASGRDVWSEMRIQSSAEMVEDHRKRYRTRAEDGEGDLFPSDPVASATVEPVQHLPANLIEFPKELVATRKARPRLAEGPFYDASRESPQLSIFEVDPALLAPPVYLSDTPSGVVAPPEWASIELDHHREMEFAGVGPSGSGYAEAQHSGSGYAGHSYPEHSYSEHSHAGHVFEGQHSVAVSKILASAVEAAPVQARPVQSAETRARVVLDSGSGRADVSIPAAEAELLVAPISDRLLAGVVDGALVTLAYLAAAVVVIASTAHPPTGRIALIASGCGLLLFGLLYQFLFLSFAEEGTPGMRYARIALCTFDDDNPSAQQMQMRIPAMLFSVLPAGLGLLWAVFDGDHLGWHDRLTRTYQRKY
jgi:uncharacterized RDD family membrane protein YckC